MIRRTIDDVTYDSYYDGQNFVAKYPGQHSLKYDYDIILDKIDNWENLSDFKKGKILSNFLNINEVKSDLIDYFNKYLLNLTKNALNYYTKGVIKAKF